MSRPCVVSTGPARFVSLKMMLVPSGDQDGSVKVECWGAATRMCSFEPSTPTTAMLAGNAPTPYTSGSAPVEYRSLVPSGDQARLRRSMPPGSGRSAVTSLCGFDPSAFMIQMLGGFAVLSDSRNAIFVPSGDHVGEVSTPAELSRTGAPPPAGTTQIPPEAWFRSAYAILLPSGDHAGPIRPDPA